MRPKDIALFILFSLLVSFGVFREAMWGAKILAPLDILPNAFCHYQFMDPAANGIPANHHIIDQVMYDLPLQHVIYDNVRKGIIPWWDPYTYGGRPLLADAHINGTDPVRLLSYLTLPFELAYNWNLIIKSILTGLGMFLLLRSLGFSNGTASIFALTYQFAGCFAIFFGHPWIQGSFLYYPYLWLIWDRGMTKQFGLHAAGGSLLAAFVFYSGNLQSHVYLPLFAGAFFAGVLLARSGGYLRAFLLVSVSGFIGLLLAAPVLSNQIEFYLLSSRAIMQKAWAPIELLVGPLSLTMVFPWALGTFRTIDLSKIVNSGSLGFCVFIGTSGAMLAAIAAAHLAFNYRHVTKSKGTAFLLVAGYFLIISTPLVRILYTRSSPLAVMGLIVLAATGFQVVLKLLTPATKNLGNCLIAVMAIGVVCLQLALSFYPRFEPAIRQIFLDRVEVKLSSLSSQSLRLFQVSSFPHEVGVTNPEVALAVLSCLALGLALLRLDYSRRKRLLYISAGLGLLSVILFYSRFIPAHSVSLWNRLQTGGPAQRAAIAASAPHRSRILEESRTLQSMVFPNALPALYRVHTVHGYSALQPKSIFYYPANAPAIPKAWIADLSVNEQGLIQPRNNVHSDLSRFQWETESGRQISIIDEDLNSLSLSITPGQTGNLIRTDTFYPGWSVVFGILPTKSLQILDPCFSIVTIDASANPVEAQFIYRPRFLNVSLLLAAIGLLATCSLLLSVTGKPNPPKCF